MRVYRAIRYLHQSGVNGRALGSGEVFLLTRNFELLSRNFKLRISKFRVTFTKFRVTKSRFRVTNLTHLTGVPGVNRLPCAIKGLHFTL